MKKFKWSTAFILNSLTFGLYRIYMMYTMAKNTNEMAGLCGKTPIQRFVFAYLLGLVTYNIYPIFWYYRYMKLSVDIAKEKGVKVRPSNKPIVLTLLRYVPIYNFYLLCDIYNSNVDAVAFDLYGRTW